MNKRYLEKKGNHQQSARMSDQRQGAATILVLTMMMVFVMVAAITVDYAYMQLVRSELRVATDAAAKAGAEALARTEDSDEAIDRAVLVGSMNRVAGQNLQLAEEDILLGRVTQGNNGRWQFQEGGTPSNSVRVNSEVEPSLFFGRLLGRETFNPIHTAVAGQQEIDVCLCLDRSGSMLFDMSGVDYAYPPNNPNLRSMPPSPYNSTLWRNHLSPPHPTNSRWAVLSRAIGDFFTEVQSFNPPPYVSLVTWGSDYTMPISPSTFFPNTRLEVALPSTNNFSAQRTAITNRITQLRSQPMMGGTNLSAGLDQAVQHITSPSARTLTNKIVVLFTDGMWNAGRSPILAAQDARDAGVIVHTVSVITGAQPDLQQVASITGGMSFTTQNETQLRAAFREIAASLQIVMIE